MSIIVFLVRLEMPFCSCELGYDGSNTIPSLKIYLFEAVLYNSVPKSVQIIETGFDFCVMFCARL